MRLSTAALLVALMSAPAAAEQPAKTPAPAAKASTATRRLVSPAPAGPSADQCRAACAQNYYFCLSASEAQDCSPRWTQCRVACNQTSGLPQ
jgi:hypothetical protein